MLLGKALVVYVDSGVGVAPYHSQLIQQWQLLSAYLEQVFFAVGPECAHVHFKLKEFLIFYV